jgi:predicted ATPase
MRAVFDHSWRLLNERERQTFRELAVFRGGFTGEAARQVAGASSGDLAALVNQSLLHRASSERYEMHELLRQYAAEKLDQNQDAGETTRDHYCAYYVAALHKWAADLKGPRQQTALAEIGLDLENAHTAWSRAVERGQVERLDQAIEGLCLFYERRQWIASAEQGAGMAERVQ